MRVFVLVSLVVLVSMSSSVMAMGKSDGNEDKVKSSVKKAEVEVNKETVEAKPEVKVEAKPMVKAEEAAKVEIAEPEVDKVWLTVNSTEIMQSQLDEALAGQFANMEKSGRKLTKEMKDTFRRQVADKMIREVLVEQKIAEKKIVVSDEEANGRLTEMAEQQSMTVEAFLEMAKTQGAIEPDELKRRVKMGIGLNRSWRGGTSGITSVTWRSRSPSTTAGWFQDAWRNSTARLTPAKSSMAAWRCLRFSVVR